MPDDSNEPPGKPQSVKHKLEAELSRTGYFLADLICYFTNDESDFSPEFFCRDPEFFGFPNENSQHAEWFFSALHPDDAASLRAAIHRTLDGDSACAELRLKNPSGEYLFFRVIGRPLTDSQSNAGIAGGILAFTHCRHASGKAVVSNCETLIDSLLVSYVVIDNHGMIELCTDKAAELFCVSPEAMIGHSLLDYFADNSRDILLNDKSSGLHEDELQLKNPAGKCSWVQICVAEISRAYAASGSRMVVLRDISSRKATETQLANSEQKFRMLAESLPGVVLIMADGRIIYTNSHAGSILGYDASELLKEEFDLSSIFNLADPGGFLVNIESELIEQGRVEREVSIKKKDHTDLRCLVTLQYINYDSTKAVLCLITDVTSLYQAIDSLDETKKRYWSLFEASTDAIFLETIDGHIFDCNSACERLYGYTHAELLGKSASDLVPGDLSSMLKDLEKELRSKRGSDRSVSIEALGLHKDGNIFPTEVSINPVKLEGLECYSVTVRDISLRRDAEFARQRYEKQLLQIQKLDNLGMMANGLANDFNNLLTGIMGYADLMMRDLQANPGAREKARRIIDAARRAGEIIHQLMSYTGKLPSMFQSTSVPKLIREMQAQLSSSLPETVSVTYDFAEGDFELNVDPPMLKQALFCLVKNASESILPGQHGVIKISVYPGETTYNGHEIGYFGPPIRAGNYLKIQIADNGSGIEQSQLVRIFDPFFTTKYAGRGLGLSSVLGMLKGHRGSALIESQPGQGTKFALFLPLDNPSHASESEPQTETFADADTNRFSAGTALIADDEESVREILSEILKDFGYKTVLAENGRKALDIFKTMNDTLSIAIIDLTMPEMSGTELIREIRWLNPEIPVLLITGMLFDDKKRELEKLGVAAFLQKPFTKADLEKVFVQVRLKAVSK
ncbi:MAG: PAS domain S-box protein [Candidatus Riflebacteria bacterium]|nr:PAS domain S-box protein [Candidatus Riflebacteria bacterium]